MVVTVTAALLLASTQLDLPPGLLSAVCFVESSHNPHAIALNDGNSPSLGECMIKYPTAKLMGYHGSQATLHRNVKTNAFWAARYLSYQIKRYHGNLYQAVGAYNSGTYRPDVNKEYINKVFNAWIEGR